jgi:hypothetical protein
MSTVIASTPRSSTTQSGRARRAAAKPAVAPTTRSQDVRVLKREIAATVKELRSIEREIANVVRRMVSATLEAAMAKVSDQDAVVIARDVGGLTLQAIQQVLRGTAEGIGAVVKSHRAAGKTAPRRSPARKNGSRAASRSSAA